MDHKSIITVLPKNTLWTIHIYVAYFGIINSNNYKIKLKDKKFKL